MKNAIKYIFALMVAYASVVHSFAAEDTGIF